jgi:2-polyprenyl-3-methyl-5-hydroxy-6-metoxy-1,4-benzoquinol methylase
LGSIVRVEGEPAKPQVGIAVRFIQAERAARVGRARLVAERLLTCEINMRYKPAEERVRRQYDASYAKGYRTSDELAVASEDHKRLCHLLHLLTTSFEHEISALEIGCGTGRLFHCLKNTNRLVGIDVSAFMLEQAKRPVRSQDITVANIELRCESIFDAALPERMFEFVYSIGVLGEHSPFDSFVCAKVYNTLKPGGIFFFTVVDKSSKPTRLSRRLAESIYPLMPTPVKVRLDRRWQSFYMTPDGHRCNASIPRIRRVPCRRG